MKPEDTLFPLPEKAPRKRSPKPAQIAAFKKANGIRTHNGGEYLEASIRWLAVKVPPKRLHDGGPIEGLDIGDMFAAFGRLLEEGGWTGYGPSELSAIRDLCSNRKIPCTL